MVYAIFYQGECVYKFDTREEALEMILEYNLAFHGVCSLRRVKA